MNKLDQSQWPLSFDSLPCGTEAAQHALDEYPRESCGLVVDTPAGIVYVKCRNTAEKATDQFKVHKDDYVAASSLGEIVAFYHSHPDVSSRPSQADLVMCEVSGMQWYIIAVHKDVDQVAPVSYSELAPSGYRAPLVGRQFIHGILDCFSLIKDHYAWELGIEIPEFERQDDWWNNGQNLYMEHYEEAGFEPAAGAIRPHDVIIAQIRSKVPNHGGVYVGDTKILHHLYGRPSRVDVYGGYIKEATVAILRHRSMK